MPPETTMEKLPDDLKIEILLHLPVKSLLRFKCVSKSWLSLISKPHFANLHLRRSSQPTHRFPFIINRDDDIHRQQMRSIDLDAPFHDDSNTISLDLPAGHDVVILGSCRGFLLLLMLNKQLEQRHVVWHPSTGELKHIPSSPWSRCDTCSFCYDEPTDDYLIVLATTSSSSKSKLGFNVFSFRSNSWQGFPLSCPAMTTLRFPADGSVVNGALHWMALLLEPPERPAKIVAFDIRNKNLRHVAEPNDVDFQKEACYLRALGESLALISVGGDETHVWEMKEYGVKESWRKVLSIGCCIPLPHYYFSPLCFDRDGKLVAQKHHSEISRWDPSGDFLEHRRIYRARAAYVSSKPAIIYTETLLSLPS